MNWISLPRRSTDSCATPGTSWSAVSIVANPWTGVAFGAGRFVAVAGSGTNRVYTSTDGASWSAATVPVSAGWADVIYANGQFVVIGSGTNVLTSPNGVTWTQRTAPEANNWNGVTYGNGYYVAVARSGTNRVMRSADGITWTAHAAAQANQWFDVAFGNGRFVAVTTAGTNQTMYSDDNGATWTVGTAPAKSWNSIAYGSGRFVAVSTDSPLNIMHSTDGLSWTSLTPPAGTQLANVDYTGALFVATGDNTTATNAVLTSSDGLTWDDTDLPEAANWNGAASGNGTLVVIANTGTNRIARNSCATGSSYDWSTAHPLLYVPNPTGNWWDSFGWGVSTNGTHIVAGSPGSDADINSGGLVYVFDAAGSLLQTIHNPAPGDTDDFGGTSAIDGNLFVTSARYSDIGATDTGRAYVFNVNTGALVSTLVNPDVTASDEFGTSVAISGNLVAVGAPNNDNGAADSGSVYIFNATTGTLVTTIHNPAAAANDHFGSTVDMDGNLVVIGAPDDDPGGIGEAGSIYVYNATTGTLVSTWANPLPSNNDRFGTAVAIDGNIAIAGAGVNSAIVSYSFNATTGATIATFTNPDGGSSDFGQAVDVDGEFAVIGAGSNDIAGNNSGAIYVYNVHTGALAVRILNPEITTFDEFMGSTVSIKNGIIAAGAPFDDIGGGDGNPGSFHVFSSRSFCSGPTGPAGEMRYNADHRVVQWCDGANWHAAGPVDPTGPTGGCSTPSQGAGFVMFSSTSCTLQYCDGGTWRAMGTPSPCSCGGATDNLAGLWKMNEGSGSVVNDSSGNGNTGTAQNLDAPDWIANGRINGSLNFSGDATTEYVTVPHSASLDITGPVTVCAWVKATSFTSTGEEDMILGKGTSAPTAQYYLSTDDDASSTTKRIVFGWTNTAGTIAESYRSNGSINTGSWYHICGMRVTNDDVDIYINGVSQTISVFQGGNVTPSTAGGALAIGRGGDYNNLYWDGEVDDARVYSRALSNSDVAILYNGCP